MIHDKLETKALSTAHIFKTISEIPPYPQR